LHLFMLDASVSAKEQIVIAAERLFARHGIDGVSLRQIGAAAGNGNNSAVQYHFGSKRDLVQAIYEYRLSRLHARREALVAARSPDDVRSWVFCHLYSLMEQAEQPGSHYLRFVSVLSQHGSHELAELPDPLRAGVGAFHARLGLLLPHLVEPLRRYRSLQAEMFMVHAAAQRERERDAGNAALPIDVAVTDLVDGMVGFLEAPTSIQTQVEIVWAGELDFFPLVF
jgi:AcrR family transcriptional regulator